MKKSHILILFLAILLVNVSFISAIKVNFEGPSNGGYPEGGLIKATNGKLYGMTTKGGKKNLGVLFEYDPANNKYTKKLEFDSINGSRPYGNLMQATDGKLFGMTNLGGSLLTALVHEKKHSKNTARVTIAICYSTFALFQLLTLYFMGYNGSMPYADNMMLLQISVVVFLLTEEFLYAQIDNQKYTQLFTIFLAISGILLIFKSLNL